MAAPSDLFDLLAEWLAVCKTAAATTSGGAIDRAFVSPGAPAIDCLPQLSVYAGGPAPADTAPLVPTLAPGQRTTVAGAVHLINMTAIVVRCAPTLGANGEIPSIETLEASARAMHDDLWAIWNATWHGHRNNALFASVSRRRELFLDPAYPLPPMGEVVGWQIPIRVQLGGYDPAA